MTVANPYIAQARLQSLKRYLPVSPNRPERDGYIPDGAFSPEMVEYNPYNRLSNNRAEAMRMMAEIESICECLPGTDCGSCGAPTCMAFAEDIVKGETNADECTVNMEAVFEFREEDPLELAQRMQKRWIVRKASQPMGHQGSGRIFRNSSESGWSASELVAQVGMAGTRVGGASIFERHTNYIVTTPECTPNDILRLARLVQEQVLEHTGVELALELEVW
ncbi:MAG: hypothetical protein J6A23_12025, partial [Thermoguttaceae bacterium]|nr:hypothetical protein [Thermoguttaceae bacterium]